MKKCMQSFTQFIMCISNSWGTDESVLLIIRLCHIFAPFMTSHMEHTERSALFITKSNLYASILTRNGSIKRCITKIVYRNDNFMDGKHHVKQ